MPHFFELLFWISLLAILHSYIFYPIIIKLASFQKKNNTLFFTQDEELPVVSILLSLYNEEQVIEEKINSILNSAYPKDKLEFIIGSDCSNDNTNAIVSQLAEKHDIIRFFPFQTRQGKPSVMNQLNQSATGSILILTDANVIFDKNTIYEVVKHFKNTEIGLVDSRMINKGLLVDGISVQESKYISFEVSIKNMESRIWGTMMGPFGGCYAIRKELFSPVPANYLVDDFYVNMRVFEQGYKAINNLDALVYEDVSNNLKEEFRRKIRIATGNFQNLNTFGYFLKGLIGTSACPRISNFGLAFSFFSHKVLRWVIPFFILLLITANIAIVFTENTSFLFYKLSFISLLASLCIPLLDNLLKKTGIHIGIFRFITHFYTMNLALMFGFFSFLKGVKSGIWQPTKRNQSTSK